MIKEATRLDVKLTNHELLAQLMTLNGYSVRSLTDAVNLHLVRQRSTVRVTRSVIGHLRSGHRKACKPEVAEAVAGLFKLPTPALFSSHVSKVQREVR